MISKGVEDRIWIKDFIMCSLNSLSSVICISYYYILFFMWRISIHWFYLNRKKPNTFQNKTDRLVHTLDQRKNVNKMYKFSTLSQ